jgi:hypothetical protein
MTNTEEKKGHEYNEFLTSEKMRTLVFLELETARTKASQG